MNAPVDDYDEEQAFLKRWRNEPLLIMPLDPVLIEKKPAKFLTLIGLTTTHTVFHVTSSLYLDNSYVLYFMIMFFPGISVLNNDLFEPPQNKYLIFVVCHFKSR